MDEQKIIPPVPVNPEFTWALRAPAWFVSFIFHPVWLPLMVTGTLVWLHPMDFAGFTPYMRFRMYFSVAENTILLPVFTVVMLKLLGFSKSLLLEDRKERIVPYMATMIFYFWLYLDFHKQQNPPLPGSLYAFLLGNFIIIIFLFFFNIFFKISAHAAGAGALIGVVMLLVTNPGINITIPLMLVLLIAGMVLSSRLILSAHNGFEVYTGLAVGIIGQLLGRLFL